MYIENQETKIDTVIQSFSLIFKEGENNIMISKIDRKATRQRRHLRVRRKISGTPECPRLCVYRMMLQETHQ